MQPNNPPFLHHPWMKLLAACLIAIAALIALPTLPSAQAANPLEITVYRDPSCHCCERWLDHLTTQGFHPKSIVTPDVAALKQQYGVPNDLTSCHTALIQGYVIEGHVPAADIKRLLAEQSPLAGLTVPGMPIGTPGMESGTEHEPFTVVAFDRHGHPESFNHYSF